MTQTPIGPQPPRRHARPLALGAAITAALLVPVGAVAATGFTDVAPDSVHADGIEFAVDAGVTAGCGDGSAYCPSDAVTREQMATFLHRLSGHADGIAPSVDAATVGGMTPEDLQGQEGPQGQPGANALVSVDTFEYTDRISNDGPSGTTTSRELGTYTKLEDDTVLRITGSPYLHAGSSESGTCSWWVTVDGLNSDGETGRDGFVAYANSSDPASRSYVAYYADVDAGDVDLASVMMHHGGTHTCYEGHQMTAFSHTVSVEELRVE